MSGHVKLPKVGKQRKSIVSSGRDAQGLGEMGVFRPGNPEDDIIKDDMKTSLDGMLEAQGAPADESQLPQIVTDRSSHPTVSTQRASLKAQNTKDSTNQQGKSRFHNKRPSLWERLATKNEKTDNGETDAADDKSKKSNTDKSSSGSQNLDGDQTKNGRFKTLVRMIKTNLLWAKDLEDKHDEESDAFIVNRVGEQQEALTFDLNQYLVKNLSYGGLTPRVRRILCKHPLERSTEELCALRDVVERLRCFTRYSRKVKQELARVISYERFEDGRIIIQQGHTGMSFYFIVTGKVIAKVTEIDKYTGQKHTQVVGELGEGSSFGELALLHNIKRTATIICKGDCEFLRVDKQDFESVLKASYEEEWMERLKALMWISYFKDWPQADLESCNNTCKLKEYPPDKVIIGNTTETTDFVYFVVSGEIQVVREVLLMVETKRWKEKSFCLASSSQMDSLLRKRELHERRPSCKQLPERRLWTLCTMKKGLYFGTGEDLTDTYLITKTHVECLLVPRVALMRLGRGRLLEQLRDNLNKALPDNMKAFSHYLQDMKWEKYKQCVVSEVISKRSISNTTTLDDVPSVIRTDYASTAVIRGF